MNNILDGKLVSVQIKNELKKKVKTLKQKPHLAVIMIGNNPASEIYINGKKKDAEEIGINFTKIEIPENTKEKDVLSIINDLNTNNNVTGIIIQLPLPKQFNERKILNQIAFQKDVDGLTTKSIGALHSGEQTNIPCTPKGIIKLLKYYNIPIIGQNVVIVGRSNLVGKPLSTLFLQENATVTLCHSKTVDLKKYTETADILVVAVGKKHLITADMVKNQAIVIDVGINRGENKKITGDVDFSNISKKAKFITPVPGGVGPMTRVMLLENIVNGFNKN